MSQAGTSRCYLCWVSAANGACMAHGCGKVISVLLELLCAAVGKPVEFVLVDGGTLQSRSAAISIGAESRAAFSTLVFQNLSIEASHRWAVPCRVVNMLCTV